MNDPIPVLFVGHGSPMNAVEDNAFSRRWAQIARELERPRAIVCISAHWQTRGTCVTAMTEPATLYDFQGFPKALYQVRYPAPGAPDLAREIISNVSAVTVRPDMSWGLDHGTWSVLCRMFPEADIPVVQLSLDIDLPAEGHYQLGGQLAFLRRKGVLVVGSGNMVHNLGAMVWKDMAFDWATDFDAQLARLIAAGDHQALIGYDRLGPHAARAIPTNEHYLPLLYTLALQNDSDALSFFCRKVTLGSISMRTVRIG